MQSGSTKLHSPLQRSWPTTTTHLLTLPPSVVAESIRIACGLYRREVSAKPRLTLHAVVRPSYKWIADKIHPSKSCFEIFRNLHNALISFASKKNIFDDSKLKSFPKSKNNLFNYKRYTNNLLRIHRLTRIWSKSFRSIFHRHNLSQDENSILKRKKKKKTWKTYLFHTDVFQ